MRNETVTYTKTIGIILMVLGHAMCGSKVEQFVGLFHMPLFFIMSGYCFNPEYLSNARNFIIKRIKRLYIPFVLYGLLFVFLHNAFMWMGVYAEPGEHWYSITDIARKSFNAVFRMMTGEPLICTFWFLKSMFWGSLIFFLCRKYLRTHIAVPCILVIAIFLRWFNIGTPFFHIDATDLLAATFIYVGHISRIYTSNIKSWTPIIFSAVLIWGVGIALLHASMLNFAAWQIIPLIAVASSATFLIYWSLSFVKHFTLLSVIGQHTLTIMIWHLVCFKLVSFAITGSFQGFPINYEYATRGWWVVYLVAGVAIPTTIAQCLSRKTTR